VMVTIGRRAGGPTGVPANGGRPGLLRCWTVSRRRRLPDRRTAPRPRTTARSGIRYRTASGGRSRPGRYRHSARAGHDKLRTPRVGCRMAAGSWFFDIRRCLRRRSTSVLSRAGPLRFIGDAGAPVVEDVPQRRRPRSRRSPSQHLPGARCVATGHAQVGCAHA